MPVSARIVVLFYCALFVWPFANFVTFNSHLQVDSLTLAGVLGTVYVLLLVAALITHWAVRQLRQGLERQFAGAVAAATVVFFLYSTTLSTIETVFDKSHIELAPHYGYAVVFCSLRLCSLLWCAAREHSTRYSVPY